MLNKHQIDHSCLFDTCNAEETLSINASIEVVSPCFKKQKKSLKQYTTSKQSAVQSLCYQPLSQTNRASVPTFVQSQRTPLFMQPMTPKPQIRFSWNNDLAETVKKETKEQPILRGSRTCDQELQKTRPMHKIGGRLADLKQFKKTSLISIPDNEIRSSPKVEESVIMVDYFNPPSQQLLSLQAFARRKFSQVL